METLDDLINYATDPRETKRVLMSKPVSLSIFTWHFLISKI